jgi:hypothetical protein
MSAYGQGNKEKYYLIHIIAIKHLPEQKGTDKDVRKAFQVAVEMRKELEPLLQAQDNKTEFEKEEHKNKVWCMPTWIKNS